MRICFFFFLILTFCIETNAQDKSKFRYEHDFLSPAFYKERRKEVRDQLPDSSMAIIFSSPVKNRSNDTDYPFHQRPQFYYLTGFTEPNSLLLIFKSSMMIDGQTTNEIMFIPQKDKEEEVWTGRLASIEEAKDISGLNAVSFSSTFRSVSLSKNDFKKIFYLSLPSGVVDNRNDSTDLYDLIEIFKDKFSYPPANGDSYLLNKIISGMRAIKHNEEIELLKRSIAITCEGHNEMMRALAPGMSEYQAQAIGEYVFKNLGAEDTGYPSICGGGENSCILHYEYNRRPLKDGELILLDMGAEYHGYSADVTRTIPVGGKFNPQQRIIYDLVKKAQDSAFSMCKPGNAFNAPHHAAVEVIKKGLFDLGIITDPKQYSTYFMHGTSHYLGLDVHDAGTISPLSKGNVITVEPGIYIPENSQCDHKWWNIGIRIEDDVLITSDGYENLSFACPTDVNEIEKMMEKQPIFIIPGK